MRNGIDKLCQRDIHRKPDDIELLAATFTFTDDNSSVSEKNVSSIKAGNEFRLMLPDGFPILRKLLSRLPE